MRVTEMDKGEFMVLAFAEWGRKAAQGDIEITLPPAALRHVDRALTNSIWNN